MPTRAVRDLLSEPEGEGNKSHAAQGGVIYMYSFKAHYRNTSHKWAVYNHFDVIHSQPQQLQAATWCLYDVNSAECMYKLPS